MQGCSHCSPEMLSHVQEAANVPVRDAVLQDAHLPGGDVPRGATGRRVRRAEEAAADAHGAPGHQGACRCWNLASSGCGAGARLNELNVVGMSCLTMHDSFTTTGQTI